MISLKALKYVTACNTEVQQDSIIHLKKINKTNKAFGIKLLLIISRR